MDIGFIGLGNMGSGMASNLLSYCLDNGSRLLVYDINADVTADFAAKGAMAWTGAADVAQRSKILFTSLPSAKEINQIAPDILSNLPVGAVWFETSTNDLSEWEKVKAMTPAHVTLVDAPVTGGTEGAAAGTLTMLLGADQTILNDHRDLLSVITGRAVRMGPSGAGYVAKLCQLHLNYLVAQGIGETLMLAAKADLDLSVLHGVLMQSCAQSYVVDNYIPKVLDGSYDPSFRLGLADKDMGLINGLAEHLEVPLPLGSLVYKSYQEALKKYGFDVPHLEIIRLIEEQVDLKLRY